MTSERFLHFHSLAHLVLTKHTWRVFFESCPHIRSKFHGIRHMAYGSPQSSPLFLWEAPSTSWRTWQPQGTDQSLALSPSLSEGLWAAGLTSKKSRSLVLPGISGLGWSPTMKEWDVASQSHESNRDMEKRVIPYEVNSHRLEKGGRSEMVRQIISHSYLSPAIWTCSFLLQLVCRQPTHWETCSTYSWRAGSQCHCYQLNCPPPSIIHIWKS